MAAGRPARAASRTPPPDRIRLRRRCRPPAVDCVRLAVGRPLRDVAMSAQPIGIFTAAGSSAAVRRNGSVSVNRRLPDRARDPVAWQMLSDIGLRRVLAPGAVLSTDSERGGVVVLVEDGAVKVVGVAENG